MDKFTWKVIPNFPKYKVCKETQQVIKISTNRVISQRLWAGYLRCNLFYDKGIYKTVKIHSIIGRTFVPGYRSGLTIDHIDGNKLNNHPNNLEWVSLSENLTRSWETGLHSDESLKWNDDDIRWGTKSNLIEVKDYFGTTDCRSLREASRLIGCAHSTISKLLKKNNKCTIKGYTVTKK